MSLKLAGECKKCGVCCQGCSFYSVISEEQAKFYAMFGLPIFEHSCPGMYLGRFQIISTCVNYDPEVGCKIYEDRPPKCRAYPDKPGKLEPGCGYRWEESDDVD